MPAKTLGFREVPSSQLFNRPSLKCAPPTIFYPMDLFGDNSDSEVEPFGAGLVEPAPILKPRIIETTFDGLLSSPLKLHEDLAKGCGGRIWPAGETLAKYLLRRYGGGSNELMGKRIAELGAGGGLVGLVPSGGDSYSLAVRELI